MKKLLIPILILLAVGTYINRDALSNTIRKDLIQPASLELSELLTPNDTLPEPLRLDHITQPSYLTTSGIIANTNTERSKEGLSKLTVNAKLTEAAQAKVDDMFAQQYFEHQSPDGKGPSDLAKAAGYEYILVGENLALGNFKDDADLLEGWMNSPGHRANIMNTKYQEIGVAVKQGMYQGKKTWLAVQEFGTPLSSCPGVDGSLKSRIELNEKKIKELEVQADAKRAELETAESRSEYNQKVDEYNAIATEINRLVEETKALVQTYNSQVNAFNACIQK